MENSPDERSETLSTTDEVLSVQQLNQRISDVVDTSEPLQDVRCYGEVTNLGGSNAALYFTLTDGTHELPCMLWRSRYRNMDIDLEDKKETLASDEFAQRREDGLAEPWGTVAF
jgi:exodeoxyribonuclease VII large subunit